MNRPPRRRDRGANGGNTTVFSLDTIRAARRGGGTVVAALTIAGGPQVGRIIRLGDQPVELGRSAECTATLLGRGVSRRHSRIERDPQGGYVILDLGSTNGTVVNEERIERLVLADGDRIQVGPDTALKFAYEDSEELAVRERRYDESIRDDLTGIHNRRYFVRALEHELAYTARHGEPTSLLMADIDHFKSVNDRFGHGAGDHVLSRVADALAEHVRMEDVVARLGGEEFAVVLRGQGATQARETADRLRRLVAAMSFSLAGEAVPVTISIGVATVHDPGGNALDTLLREADERLYRAKQMGRDRVVGQD